MDIVYTMFHNLDKRQDMDTGTIGFKDDKQVKKVRNVKKDRDVLNPLNKLKSEDRTDVDLRVLKEERLEVEKNFVFVFFTISVDNFDPAQ